MKLVDGNKKNSRNILQPELDLEFLCSRDGIKLNVRKCMCPSCHLEMTG